MVEETIIHDSELLENNQPEEKSERLCKLPISRVRTIIKADQDVSIASQESVFLISKATELFIEYLAKDAYAITQTQKRKTIQKKDIDAAIDKQDELAFLEGTLD